MDESPIHLHREHRVATLTISRPPLNILDIPTIDRLGEVIAGLAADPELLVVVLRGAGERAFSAGVAVQDHTPDRVGLMLDSLHGTIRRLRDLDAITVAAVQGQCLGGGMELAASCDLIVATEDVRFAQPEINLGCFAPVAAALYPSRIGAGRTLDLLLANGSLSLDAALLFGLVNRWAPAGKLDEEVAKLVTRLTSHSAPVIRLTKKAVRAGRDLPFAEALAETERIYKEELLPLADVEEGAAAFMEKRRPIWKHR
jgi:cyclohexa-1,5-dienecarbonyl-CoA hydratase